MALNLYREFRGVFELVGSFSDGPRSERTFTYADVYLRSTNAHPVSECLPLQKETFKPSEHLPFFDGVLPEGPVRTELSRRFQVAPSDALGLLERIGGECVGALAFCSSDDESMLQNPHYRQLELADVESLQKSGVIAVADEMQASRLSLAGAQSKMGWFLPQGINPGEAALTDWAVPINSAPSTHVVKVADRDHLDLPYNEHACMEVARMCGLPTAASWIMKDVPGVLVSQRYDRHWSDAPKFIDGISVPWRLHQEDFCQMLGWPSYLKYEKDPTICYARICGKLISAVSTDPIGDARLFARQVAFDYLVGNCDSHLKNHSMLYLPDWRTRKLAPVYDIVCTTIMGYDRDLGMDIGDHRCIDEVNPEDFELLAEDLKLPTKLLRRDCATLLERFPNAFASIIDQGGQLADVAQCIFDDAHERLRVLKAFSK